MNDNKKWYRSLRRSTLTPPDYVFGIVWTILYITMFISFILVATHKQCKYTCFPLIIFYEVSIFIGKLIKDQYSPT